MASVTKSSGRYFTEEERVWEEARRIGMPPFIIGRWNGEWVLPNPLTTESLRPLFRGAGILSRVQHNRVGCYDFTFTTSKSVSLVLFGLAPPSAWKAGGRIITAAVRPDMERLVANQRINAGAQGAAKVPSEGVAVLFTHFLSKAQAPHAHLHAAVPNLSVDKNGKVGSIANARDGFEAQGVLRASFHKGLDEALQRRGYRTVRVGKAVEVVGIPAKMIEAFSPARAAINEARAKTGHFGPRAADFYARQARREVPPEKPKTNAQLHATWQRTAKKFGVTRKSLRTEGRPEIRDREVRAMTAFNAAREALKDCSRRFGAFTENQYRERLYTVSIGRPTTRAALDKEARLVLERPGYAGVRKVVTADGQTCFLTRSGKKAAQKAERPYLLEAFEALKTATLDFGKAVLVRTAQKGAALLDRVTAAVKREPPVLRLDGRDTAEFLKAHRPTPYLRAHAKALLKGFISSGNPHDRADTAEREYARLRAHDRLPKGAVLVVEAGGFMTASELRQLAAVAKRDGASVVLSRPEPENRGTSQAHRFHREQRI